MSNIKNTKRILTENKQDFTFNKIYMKSSVDLKRKASEQATKKNMASKSICTPHNTCKVELCSFEDIL